MAVQTRSFTKRFNVNGALVALSVVGMLLAGLPIAAAVVSGLTGQGSGPATAYASAPAGQYAVVAQSGLSADTIFIAPVNDPSAVMEIATVPHLDGFYTRGAVSPDGRLLSLIVVDGGTPVAPTASLVVINLETGGSRVVAAQVDTLQSPVWSPDSTFVVATRGGDSAPGTITVLSIPATGSGETAIQTMSGVLGVYPVGYDSIGRLVTVVIDGDGSTVYRDGAHAVHLGNAITRDWELNADGTAIAFVETNLDAGARYLPRVVELEGANAAVTAQALALDTGAQALGSAWRPGAVQPEFGVEPNSPLQGGVSAQTLAGSGGFDVPLGYSRDGRYLAVQHWNGDSFSRPGDVSIEIVSEEGRVVLDSATEFLGWAAR